MYQVEKNQALVVFPCFLLGGKGGGLADNYKVTHYLQASQNKQKFLLSVEDAFIIWLGRKG